MTDTEILDKIMKFAPEQKTVTNSETANRHAIALNLGCAHQLICTKDFIRKERDKQ